MAGQVTTPVVGIPTVMQAIPGTINPDALSWHQGELKKAVDAANAEKDDELDDTRKEVVALQKEHRELKTRHDAAKEVIEDLNRKVETIDEDSTEHATLEERYNAAVDLLDESIKKLKEFGLLKRRVETLEGLLDASIKKLQRERKDTAIAECLDEAPKELHDTMKPVLQECSTPEQVEDTFRRLMAMKAGKPLEKEPLPESQDKKDKDNKDKKPTEESAPVTRPKSFVSALSSRMNNL